MQLKCQGMRQACVLYSLAMCLNVDVDYLEDHMGYATDEPFFETEGDQVRSHHAQECFDAALAHGYAIVPVEAMPQQGNESGEVKPLWDEMTALIRLQDYMHKFDGMVHLFAGGGHLHMCAWSKDDQMIYDPNGRKYPLDDKVQLITFYALVPTATVY